MYEAGLKPGDAPTSQQEAFRAFQYSWIMSIAARSRCATGDYGLRLRAWGIGSRESREQALRL